MRRLPWWAVGVVAAAIAFAVLAIGVLLVNVSSDPPCGLLPVAEMSLLAATMLGHSWTGFYVALSQARPGRGRQTFLRACVISVVAFAADLTGIGPQLLPGGPCNYARPRMLPGIVLTGVAAALYARAGTSRQGASAG